MSTLYESYTTGDASELFVIDTRLVAQTITATTTNHDITSVEIKISKQVGFVANVYAKIYGLDGSDLPDDTNILATSVAVAAASIPALASPDWIEFTFSFPARVLAGTKFAIVLVPDTDAKYIYWRYDNANGYAGGIAAARNGSWAASAPNDCMFRVYGNVFTVTDKTYSRELIAISNNEVWREATAGTMTELTDANGDIDTSGPLNATVAFQKLFIANDTKLRVVDFVNTKITTADVGAHPPYRGVILTGGTSGATMVVDYITAITDDSASIIYGKRTSNVTFSSGETVTGTNPVSAPSPYYSGASGAVSFATAAAETAPSHWYDWTVYGNDAANYGAMPVRADKICNFMGCLMLSGDPNYPHQWYMSRQLNPFDWLYAQDDAQSAVAGNDADAGEVGDIIVVNIPYKDDYVVHACANTLWYMTGHPCQGGTIVELDLTTGILGDRAFCWDDVGNLYMMCTVGILRIPPSFGQPKNLTIDIWPDFISDLAFNSALHRITMLFNPEDRGIHIFKTTLLDGTSSAWWYDLRSEGLFPDSYAASHGVFSGTYYQSEDPSYRKLLVGCNDGYIRFWDRSAKNDDSTAIDSYVGFAPLGLSLSTRKDGNLSNIDIVTGGGAAGGTQADSDDVYCKVHVARTAAKIIEKLDGNSTPKLIKTFSAPGYKKSNIDRRSVRGQWGGIVIGNNTEGESWSMERLIVDTKEVGRSL